MISHKTKHSKHHVLLSILLILTMCLMGCNDDSGRENTDKDGTPLSENGTPPGADFIHPNSGSDQSGTATDYETLEIDTDLKLSDYDTEVAFADMDKYTVTLSNSGCSSDAPETAVQINDSLVTITDAGVYTLTGTLSNGRIIVNAADDDHVQLILSGVDISSSSGSPVHVENAKKVVVTLANGTLNTLTDTTPYTEASTVSTDTDTTAEENDDTPAGIFSRDDLTLTGSGTLTVDGDNNGIVSKDKLKVTDGTYVIDAGKNGMRGKDCLAIWDGDFTITTGNDAMKSNGNGVDQFGFVKIFAGTFRLNASGDGIYGEYLLQIEGGTFDITSTAKSLKSSYSLLLKDGDYHLSATDDAIHSNTLVTIEDGTYDISSKDDGIHANDTLTINGGIIDVTNSYEGLEAVTINVAGGDISVVASDDGINANSGDSSFGAGGDMWNPGGNMTKPDGGAFPFDSGETGSTLDATDVAAVTTTSDNDATIWGRPGGGGGWGGGMGGGMDGDLTNSATMVNISGGTIYLSSSGDGLDSNGSVTMTGGTLIIEGPTNSGNGALDYAGTFSYQGGTLIALGASGMAQSVTPADGSYALYVTYTRTEAAGSTVRLVNENGDELLSFTPTKSFSSLVFGSPELTTGSVTLYSDDSELCSFVIESNATSISSDGSEGYNGGMWNPGGGMQRPGGGGWGR